MKDLSTIRERVCRDLATSGFIPAAKLVASLSDDDFRQLVRHVQSEG